MSNPIYRLFDSEKKENAYINLVCTAMDAQVINGKLTCRNFDTFFAEVIYFNQYGEKIVYKDKTTFELIEADEMRNTPPLDYGWRKRLFSDCFNIFAAEKSLHEMVIRRRALIYKQIYDYKRANGLLKTTE